MCFRPQCGPGVDSASNRNEYQEYFLGGKGGRCVGLTTLSPSCADCLEIWEPQPPGTHYRHGQACNGLVLPLPYSKMCLRLLSVSTFEVSSPKLTWCINECVTLKRATKYHMCLSQRLVYLMRLFCLSTRLTATMWIHTERGHIKLSLWN